MSSSGRWPWARLGVGVIAALAILLLVVLTVVATRPRAAVPAPGADAPYVEGRVLVSDTFQRTVDKGWGKADVGGAYRTTNDADFQVAGGTGMLSLLRPGTSRLATLDSAQGADLTVSIDVVVPRKPQRGNGLYVAVQLRSNGAFHYRAVLRFDPAGRAFLSLSRTDGSAEDILVLTDEAKTGAKVKPGQRLTLTVSVSGTTPVRLSADLQGLATPVTSSAEDTTASRLLAGGPLGLWAYLAGGSDGNQSVVFDNLNVHRLERAGTATARDGAGALTGPAAAEPENGGPPALAPTARGSVPLGETRYEVPAEALFVRPHGSVTAAGTFDDPYGSIQQAVDAAPDGSTLVVRGGTYHESVLLPIDKVVHLQSYPGERVWLDGSRKVTGWRRSGAVWQVPWTHTFDSSPTYTRGAKDRTEPGWTFVNPSYPMAAHPDQVWLDGQSQVQVGSRRQVVTGTFYVDPAQGGRTREHPVEGADDRRRRRQRSRDRRAPLRDLGLAAGRGDGQQRRGPAREHGLRRQRHDRALGLRRRRQHQRHHGRAQRADGGARQPGRPPRRGERLVE